MNFELTWSAWSELQKHLENGRLQLDSRQITYSFYFSYLEIWQWEVVDLFPVAAVAVVRHIEEILIRIIMPIPVTIAEATKIAIVMVDDIEEVVVDMLDGKAMNNLSIRGIVPDDMKDIAILIDTLRNDLMTFINVNFIK